MAAFSSSCGVAHARPAPTDPPPATAPAPDFSSAPAPFLCIVDAANTLRSYDADGRPLKEMPVDRQRAVLNGGAIFAMGKLYLTYERAAAGEPGSAIAAFNAQTLKPLMLHRGAFKSSDADDPGRYTGIAFDPEASEFYVATQRLGVLMFDRTGKYLPRTPEAKLDVTGIAFDSGQNGLWGVTARHAVVRFGRADSAPVPGIELESRLNKRGQEPIAVAACRAETDGAASTALVVVFRTNRHGASEGAARAFDLTGRPMGPAFEGKIVNPHGIACTAHGDVYIAADNGLLAYRLDGSRRSPPGALASLDSPILGVAAAP